MNLKGRTVLLTGATSGIGEQLAKDLIDRGCKLILPARRIERLSQFKERGARVFQVDFSDSEEIDVFIREILKEKELLPSVLILNAGISQRANALETTLEVDRRIMEVNYFSNIHLTKKLLPSMLESGKAYLSVISSLVGKFGTPRRSGYAASKHALHGFYDALRAEHQADQLTVSLICPGYINTELPLQALTNDGTPQGFRDQAQLDGMTVEKFSDQCIRAIQRERSEIYIGGKEVFAVYLKRFLPGLFEKVIRRYRIARAPGQVDQ